MLRSRMNRRLPARWVALAKGVLRGAFFLLLVGSAAAASDGKSPDSEYQLGAGDLLKINVFGYPDMSADVRVDEAGSITYAYVGQLEVGGHSARDVETLV